jgi:DNA modification methylase
MEKDTAARDLKIEWLPISELKPDPRNPKQHSARQIKQLALSIKTFGNLVPVLIDRENKILAGHGRVLAQQRLGRAEVPVIRIEHLTPKEARAFSIADNRLTELSTWDARLLGDIFRELSAVDLNFSLEVTGFSMAEIDLRIEQSSVSIGSGPDPADEPANSAGEPPVTRPGDLWQAGRHLVRCGDALDPASCEGLMQGARADVVFTDPPYNLPIDGHVSGKGRVRHREFAMASGEMTPAQFSEFLKKVLRLLVRHSAAGSLHYICMDWRHLFELLTAAEGVYFELKNLCAWVKDNAGMGSLYRSQHELVLVFKSGAAPHRNNVQLGQYGRNRSNVWHYPSVSNFGRRGEEGHLQVLHPTVKPVALVADAIMDCSSRGDIVLDPFLGSGTTLIAAERVGRICRGMELDPLYVDAAMRRWQCFTGDNAIHAASGWRFDDLARESEAHHG